MVTVKGHNVPNWTLWAAGIALAGAIGYFVIRPAIKNAYHNWRHPVTAVEKAPEKKEPEKKEEPSPTPLPKVKDPVCEWVHAYLKDSPVQVYDGPEPNDDLSSRLTDLGINIDAASHLAEGLDANPALVEAFEEGYAVRSAANETSVGDQYVRVAFGTFVPKPTPTPAPTPTPSPEATPEPSPAGTPAPTPPPKPYRQGIQVVRTQGYVIDPTNPEATCFTDITQFLDPKKGCETMGVVVRGQSGRVLEFIDPANWAGNNRLSFVQCATLEAYTLGNVTQKLPPTPLAGMVPLVCGLAHGQRGLPVDGSSSLEDDVARWVSPGPTFHQPNLADYFNMPQGIPKPLNERP